MEVPTLNRQVGLDTGGISPKVQPISEASTGLAVDEANVNLGRTVQGMGEKLGAHMLAKQKIAEEQEANDRVRSGVEKLKELTSKITNTFGANATPDLLNGTVKEKVGGPLKPSTGKLDINTGANVAGYNIEKPNPDSFDATSSKLRQESLAGLNPEQQRLAGNLWNAHSDSMRDVVVRHLADQGRIAEEQGMSATILTNADTFALNPTKDDSKKLLDSAIGQAVEVAQHQGKPTENIESKVSDEFAARAVKYNPANADYILKNLKLSSEGKALVQGAQVEAAQQDIANAAMTYKTNPDGTPSLTGSLEYAKSKIKDFTPEQQQKVVNFVHSYVGVKDAEIKQGWEQNKKDFHDEAMKMYNSGANSDQITQQLVKEKSFNFSGMPATDKSEQEDFIRNMFMDKAGAVGKALTFLSPEQKLALDAAKFNLVGWLGTNATVEIGKDGKSQKSVDVAYEVLSNKVAGSKMTPDEIRNYARTLVDEKVKVPGRFWGTNEEPLYKYEQEKASAYAISFGEMEKVYGSDAVRQARNKFGDNASPALINEALNRVKGKRK